MDKLLALRIIFFISIAGLLFSGYLSYMELFAEGGCSDAIVSCGTKDFSLLGLPACVYGFVMYLLIFSITAAALFIKPSVKSKKK